MSWFHLRATASRLRAVPQAALSFQALLQYASPGQAAAFQSRSRAIAAQKIQRRHLSDSSSATDTDTSKKKTPKHGNRKAGQGKNQAKHRKHPTAPKTPKVSGPLLHSGFATQGAGEPVGLTQGESSLLLHFEGIEQPLRLPKLWLRDACTCESCVNPSSGQKTFATTDVPLCPDIDSHRVESNGDIRIVWANDFHSSQQKHESVYSKQFVDRFMLNRQRNDFNVYTNPRSPWAQAGLKKSLAPITYSDWIAGGEAFASAFQDLWRYGIIFLRDMPQREDAVEDIARQVGHLQSTFYGMTWDVVSKPRAENVAYTNVFLGLHHDLMYWHDVPKIQILHCLENSCEGGDSIFSDGLRAALEIQDGRQEHFDVLSKLRVPYHYDIAPHKYRQNRTVFDVSQNGIVKDIYWSPPFQAPLFALNSRPFLAMSWTDKNMARWHAAAKNFKDNIEAPENVYQYKMKPGECVLFDNRRVFHGRREFNTSSGKRWLKGGYISEEVFKSKGISLMEAGLLGAAAKGE